MGRGRSRDVLTVRCGWGRVAGRGGNVAACDHVVVPVSLVFTSDTHVPKRARDLPHSLWAAIDAADVVVHAGDWVDVALLDQFEERSRRLVGGVRQQRPRAAPRAAAGGGPRRDRGRPRSPSSTRRGTRRAARCGAPPASPTPTCSSSGTATSRGTRPRRPGCGCSTPGSPTDRRRQPHGTFVTAVADDGAAAGRHLPRRPAARVSAAPPLDAARGRAAGLPGLRGAARARSRRRRRCAAPPGTPFDRARQGHVTLLPPGHRPPSGDSAEMVADRVAFLDAGHYAGITRGAGRRRASTGGAAGRAARPRRRHRPPPGRRARPAARRGRRRPGLLAATPPAGPRAPTRGRWRWSPTPGPGCRSRDAAVDRVLVVFAPRNGPEIARVLRPGGPAGRRHAGRRPPGRAGRAAGPAARRPGQGRPAGRRRSSRTCEPVADDGAPRGAAGWTGRPSRTLVGHGTARPAPGAGGARAGARRRSRSRCG